MHLSSNSSQPALQAFLHKLTSRSVLSDEEERAILGLPAHADQVRPNREFVSPGVPVDHACLIVAGFVGRFSDTEQGNRQITAIHVRGDMADLHSVVQPSPTSALQALSVATILRIPHSALRAVSARYPAVAEAFWRDCMVDAGVLSQWVVTLGRRDAKQRMAHLICEVAIRIEAGEPSDGMMFEFPITQTQLADATGLTPVHVNRTLQALRLAGLIGGPRGNLLTILRWDALAATGGFDAAYPQPIG